MSVARSESDMARWAPPGPVVVGGAVAGVLILAALAFVALRPSPDQAAAGRSTVIGVGEAMRRLASQQETAKPAAAVHAIAAPAKPVARPRPATVFLTARWACGFMDVRAQHVGETVVFQGEYLNDHVGAALLRPLGCNHGVPVASLGPGPQGVIGRADPRPWTFPRRRLVGLFTARLIRGGGVWLAVEDVRGLHEIGKPSSSAW